MKILIDINHPAHVHFFRNPITLLVEQGHEVLITSRDKEMAVDLLDELHIPNRLLSALGSGGLFSLGKELVVRNWALLKVVREFRPDVMAAIGGTSIAHVGFLTRTPSLAFYDTENARLQNLITYPFASCVLVPRCYESWLPKRRHIRYAGYHELSYLHADYFDADLDIACSNGLETGCDNYFIRVVSWQANHDVGEEGWTPETLMRLIDKLGSSGNVIISSERDLPDEFAAFMYKGKVSQVHHVLGHCRLFIGESATMASECAVMGVPAIYAAGTGRGYTNEQEIRYGLVRNVTTLDYENIGGAVDRMLQLDEATRQSGHRKLLDDTIDVAGFVRDAILNYPKVLRDYQQAEQAA